MQIAAIGAIASGAVMLAGASLMLIMTGRVARPRRWLQFGSIPLASAGVAFGVISHGGLQAAITREVYSSVTIVMLVAALLCAVAGAAAARRDQRDDSGTATR